MQLRIDQVTRALTGQPVLRGVSLTLGEGQVGCLLGSSGCGKTTLLRSIAGFESIDSGSIWLNGEEVASAEHHVAPHARGIGMVFQDHALFPHLTVAQNASFGLRQWPAAQAAARVDEVLTLVGLDAHAKRFPHQLSGGQQQRAALARALANRPRLLLLDEPFASLDRELRYRLVQEVSAILRDSRTTALWVTHDAREALQAADRVGVMRGGVIVQWDTPADLYAQPATPEVASALGDCALLGGVVESGGAAATPLGLIALSNAGQFEPGTRVAVLVRPEQMSLLPQADTGGETTFSDDVVPPHQERAVAATISEVWFHGRDTLCVVTLEDGSQLRVLASNAADLATGATAKVAFRAAHTVAFPV